MHDVALARAHGRPLAAPRRPPRRLRGRGEEDLVVAVVTQHAESVLRLARRVSICDADAQDAYQRGLEIFVKNAGRLDPPKAAAWLRTVVKHEALAVRAQRAAAVSREGADLDLQEAVHLPSPEEQVVGFDRLSRSAEALRALKPDEARALWLRAEGYSYAEIGEAFGWTYTKVNRLLAEGRARFLARYAVIESGGACGEWTPVLSEIVDGAAALERRRAAAAHLRSCAGCRATLRALRDTRGSVQALLPVGGLVTVVGASGHGEPWVRTLRFVEAVFAAAQERATATAVKLQVAADALSAGKVAAVTASAAALAGGGAVVVDQGAAPAAAPRVAHRQAVRPAAAAVAPRVVASGTVAGSSAAVAGGGAGAAAARDRVRARTAARSRRPAVRTSEFRAAASPASAGQEFRGSRAHGREFTEPTGLAAATAAGPQPEAGVASSPEPAPTSSPESVAARSPAPSTPSTPSASSSEFTREFP